MNNVKTFLWLIMSCLITHNVYALPEDRDKAITGKADQQTFSATTGVSVLTGNVLIEQGLLKILADEVTITTDNETNQLTFVSAKGNPVILYDTPSIEQGEVVVKGDLVEFSPLDEVMTAMGNATLSQTGNEAKGQRIEYNSTTGVIIIESERLLGKDKEAPQAEFILQPAATP